MRGRSEGVGRVLFFFFKQKTAYEIYQCDWSSDVCSSDLNEAMLDFVRRVDNQAQFITSHCDGAFVLAKAGLDRKSVV